MTTFRDAVSRTIAPVLDRIPDLSQEPPRKQATIGLLASIVLHVLIFLFFVLGVWLTPSRLGYVDGDVVMDEPLEIELVPMPQQESQVSDLADPLARPLMMSKGLPASEEKPENPEFESDQDMKAGSELPATGLLPLPSQEGRTDRDRLAFMDQDVIIGLAEGPSAALPPQPAQTQATPPAQPQRAFPPRPKGNQAPRTLYSPTPLSQAQLDAANEAEEDAPLPTPSLTHQPSPSEMARSRAPAATRVVPVPWEDEIAFSTAKDTPAPAPLEEPRALVDAPITRPDRPPPQEYAKLSTPPPSSIQSFSNRYRESMKKAEIEGSISNRGRPGVNAVGTPLGLYMKNVSNIIGSRWTFKVKEQMEWLSVGSARIRFTIDPAGKTGNVVVEANDSNRNFAELCAQVIRDSKLDPIPPEAREHLQNGRIEVPFTFTLYPNH